MYHHVARTFLLNSLLNRGMRAQQPSLALPRVQWHVYMRTRPHQDKLPPVRNTQGRSSPKVCDLRDRLWEGGGEKECEKAKEQENVCVCVCVCHNI